MDWVTVLLAAAVPVALLGGAANRLFVSETITEGGKTTVKRGKGIGWQFIRYCLLSSAVPIVAVLALRNKMDSHAVYAILAMAIGYAFGKIGDGD